MIRRVVPLLFFLAVMVSVRDTQAASATDDCNNPLMSGWTVGTGFNPMVSNGTGCLSSSGDSLSVWTSASFGADQFSQVTIGTAANDGGPVVRGSTSAAQGYMADIPGGDPNVGLYKITAGPTFTLLNNFVCPANIVAGDVVILTATGTSTTTFGLTRNGVDCPATPVITDSSSPHTSGRVGIFASSTSLIFDAWCGGDVGTACGAGAGNKAGPLVNGPILKGLVGGGLTQ